MVVNTTMLFWVARLCRLVDINVLKDTVSRAEGGRRTKETNVVGNRWNQFRVTITAQQSFHVT
jgi:hypothetical protein